ncbi:MAG: hypothetical protein KY475_26065 [Planctomycetes bacterium]|nr:hypothetical protein [Planctomycetota bacterium]
MTAPEILNREYLDVRAKILELAAALDRLDRASGSVKDDARMALIAKGLQTLLTGGAGRAEQVQLIFSREYEAEWRREFGL